MTDVFIILVHILDTQKCKAINRIEQKYVIYRTVHSQS